MAGRVSAALMRLLAVVGLIVGALLSTAAIASAAPAQTAPAAVALSASPAPSRVPMATGPTGDNAVCPQSDGENPADSTLLAVNRWGDVSDSFHDQLDADLWNDIFQKLQRRMLFGTMISFGNSMWQLSANLAGFATHFCLIDAVGHDADTLSASLGSAVLNNGIVALIVALGLIVVLWRTWKGAGNWKAMLRPSESS